MGAAPETRPPTPETQRAAVRRGRLAALVAALAPLAGCVAPGPAPLPHRAAIAAAARPLLSLDPDAVWTDAYNRLVEFGPESIDYLMRQPAMTQPAAPDDLQVLLHTSLVRLLVSLPTAPTLTASCLETTLGVLHFDLKVGDRPLGTIAQIERSTPRAWHELYPGDFDHALAPRIDVEADRLALREWWRTHRDQPGAVVSRPLKPRADYLWRILVRRPADRWQYEPQPRAILCTAQPGPVLLHLPTWDYNLVRATCVWLGSSPDPAVEDRLIELVGSPLPTVAHNARFALRHAPDARVRELIERYDALHAPP
jgi:hypothetical protein